MKLKIKRNDSDLLLIKSRVSHSLFGSIFIVIGVLVGVLTTGEETLICERAEQGGQCNLERSRLWGDTQIDFEIEQFEGAEVAVMRDSDGEETYRADLIVEGRIVPVSASYDSGQMPKSQIVQEITRFLRDESQPRLEIN